MNRRNFIQTASVAALGTGVGGCALFRGDAETKIVLAANIARVASELGTTAAIRADPSRRYLFEASLAFLDALLDDENYSAEKLAEALRAAGVDIFRGDNGALLAGSLVSLFRLATGYEYVVESPRAVREVGKAIAEGMRAGLATTRSKWKPSITPSYDINPIRRERI